MTTSECSLGSRFSTEIRAALARRQLPVGALADHLGISEGTAYRWISRGDWPLNEADRAARWCGYASIGDMLRAAPPRTVAS